MPFDYIDEAKPQAASGGKFDYIDETPAAAPAAPEKSFGGLVNNAMSDVGDLVGGVVGLGTTAAGNALKYGPDEGLVRTAAPIIAGVPHALKELASVWGIPEALHGRFGEALDKIKESAYQKPVSRALDVASVALPLAKATGVLKGVEGASAAAKAGELGEAASGMADTRWAKALGGTLADSKALGEALGPVEGPAEFRRLGRLGRDSGVIGPLTGAGEQAQKVLEASDTAGKTIGGLRDAAGAAPAVEDTTAAIRNKLAPKYGGGIHAPEAGEMERALEEIQGGKSGRPETLRDVAGKATELNKFASEKTRMLQAAGATTDVANALSGLNDEAILKALPPEQATRYQAALAHYGDLQKLTDWTTQRTSFAEGASRNGISNGLKNRFLHNYGYQLSAEGLDRIASFLRDDPSRFGRYAETLNKALTQGPAALATTTHLLAQNDPSFAALMAHLENK